MQNPRCRRLHKLGGASLVHPFSKKLMGRLTGEAGCFPAPQDSAAEPGRWQRAWQSLQGGWAATELELWVTEVELLPFLSEAAPPSAERGEADSAQAGVFPALGLRYLTLSELRVQNAPPLLERRQSPGKQLRREEPGDPEPAT